MKCDMDLMKEILSALEKRQPSDMNKSLEIEGYSHQEIGHHVKMMAEAGLIEAIDSTNNTTGVDWRPISLTWDGHMFLVASRDEKRWKTAKQIIKKKGISVSSDELKTLLSNLMTDGILGN